MANKIDDIEEGKVKIFPVIFLLIFIGIVVFIIIIVIPRFKKHNVADSVAITRADEEESKASEKPDAKENEVTVQNKTESQENKNVQEKMIIEGAKEYQGHYYKFFEESMTWEDAELFCTEQGGHLVCINSEGEQKFVEDLTVNSDKENIWIGGKRSGDDWIWVDGSKFSYTNWDRYTYGDEEIIKPDNYQNVENYIRYANKDITYEGWLANAGKWDDCANEAGGDVSIDSFGFVCEWQ